MSGQKGDNERRATQKVVDKGKGTRGREQAQFLPPLQVAARRRGQAGKEAMSPPGATGCDRVGGEWRECVRQRPVGRGWQETSKHKPHFFACHGAASPQLDAAFQSCLQARREG
jgi:hypothetical protein